MQVASVLSKFLNEWHSTNNTITNLDGNKFPSRASEAYMRWGRNDQPHHPIVSENTTRWRAPMFKLDTNVN